MVDTNGLSIVGHVSESGQLDIPTQLREKVGLANGGPVVVRVEDGELRVRTVHSTLAELQAQAARLFNGSGFTVDRFLNERHEEARREGDAE